MKFQLDGMKKNETMEKKTEAKCISAHLKTYKTNNTAPKWREKSAKSYFV